MTDAQLKALLEVLMSCYWAGREDAMKAENRYDTDEDLQRRAKAAVTKALGVLGILGTADHTESVARPVPPPGRFGKTVSGEVDIAPATGKFIGEAGDA